MRGERERLDKVVFLLETLLLQLLRIQYLYSCTSKASKLSTANRSIAAFFEVKGMYVKSTYLVALTILISTDARKPAEAPATSIFVIFVPVKQVKCVPSVPCDQGIEKKSSGLFSGCPLYRQYLYLPVKQVN